MYAFQTSQLQDEVRLSNRASSTFLNENGGKPFLKSVNIKRSVPWFARDTNLIRCCGHEYSKANPFDISFRNTERCLKLFKNSLIKKCWFCLDCVKDVNPTHLETCANMIHRNGIKLTELHAHLSEAKTYKPFGDLTKLQRKSIYRYSIYLSNVYWPLWLTI